MIYIFQMSKIYLIMCCKNLITIISINKAEIFYLDVLAYCRLVIHCSFHYNDQMDLRKTNNFLFEIAGRHKLLQSKYPMLPKMTILNLWNKTTCVRNSTGMIRFFFSTVIFYVIPRLRKKLWLEVNKCAFTFSSEIRQIQCTRTEFWCVQCPRPAGPSALDKHQIQASALD